MGIGRDSADFAKRGIISLVLGVFGIVLFVLIMYFGYKFLSTTYENHPYLGLMVIGWFLGDMVFISILSKYVDEVLLKKR